ncbi:MAG: hypothetical protein JWM05_3184 [Acidimicrobiales bacterium]|nr:hypothetical protein [Acidimicrobiales bacterium]
MRVRRLARSLLYLGVAGTVLGFGKFHAVAHGYDYTASSRFAWSFAYIGLLGVAAYGAGFPDLRRSRRAAYGGAVGAVAAAAAGMSAVQLVLGDALLPRLVVACSAATLVPWLVVTARLAALGATRAESRDRVVAVAAAADLAELADEVGGPMERQAALVGGLEPAEATTVSGGAPVLDLVRSTDATVLVLCRAAQLDESIVAQAALLHESGVRVRTLSLFYEQWLGKLPASELERVSLMFDIGELHRSRYGRAKRVFDLALAGVGAVALVVAVPFVLLGNLVANRGPLLYSQERVGKGGRRFRILKFRTMRMPASGDPANEWTTPDDPRITPFGALLRATHLDELPQVVNILRGDLAVVGPRPEQPRYVDELTRKLPFYDLRHLVRPGLTGWAQVRYGYAGDERDALQKLQYEFFYLRHQGLGLDLRVVGRTIRAVLGGQGRGR